MSIDAKHAYRFGFLRSEEWKSIRLVLLSKKDATCDCCGFRDWSNDVHHVWYPDRWQDTTHKHVLILCRQCHERVHQFFDQPPPTRDVFMLALALSRSYAMFGEEMTALNVIEELDFIRSYKGDERRRFFEVCFRTVQKVLTPHTVGSRTTNMAPAIRHSGQTGQLQTEL